MDGCEERWDDGKERGRKSSFKDCFQQSEIILGLMLQMLRRKKFYGVIAIKTKHGDIQSVFEKCKKYNLHFVHLSLCLIENVSKF